MATEAEVEKLKQENAELEDKLAQARELNKTKIVYAPRKLNKYEGDREQLDDWLAEASAAVAAQGLTGKNAADFIISHLDKEAKNEVKYSLSPKNTVEDILEILKKSFGEKRTDTELLDLFFHRSQGAGESLMTYAHALMHLIDRAIKVNKTKLCVMFL